MAASDGRIRVVIVTGGVGAGKSLALNALLRALPEETNRAAVCVHAFALSYGLETTPVDRSRVALFDYVFDFGGGCVCCSPRGDFTRCMHRVAQANAAGTRITHLLVETTGVAEPLVFAKLFFADSMAEQFRLDAIVHVLDSSATPLPHADDAAAPAWAAAAAAQLTAASLICINVRAPGGSAGSGGELAPLEEESSSEGGGTPLGGTVNASAGATVELVTGAAGAVTDLGSVVLDATSQLASVTLDGASNVLSGAVSSVTSLATGNVGGTTDGLGRIGTASLSTVSSGAGLLIGAATELGALGFQRATDVGRSALMGVAKVSAAVLDDAVGLPLQAAGAVGGAGRASFGFAHGVVSGAAAGIMASHGLVSDLLGGAEPAAARVVACLAPGESSAAAGALLWETIAGAGAFKVEEAVALDPDFLAPPGPVDDVVGPLFVPTVQGGHAARVACVCATEAGTPLIEARLRSWLDDVASEGRVVRVKGLVWARAGVDDTRPRLLLVDGVRGSVDYRYQHVHALSSSDGPVVVEPLCGDATCELAEHKEVSNASSLTSKLFLLVEPGGESAALLKKTFRECFVPPGYAWAADIEIDFPPGGAAAPRGIERQLKDGPAVVVWRVGPRFYACEAHCPHAGAPLADASVLDMEDAASTSLGPLLSCALHFFTWDLESGQPISALGCGALKTYDVCVVLGSLYVSRTPQRKGQQDEEQDNGFARRPSWRNKDPQ